MPCRVTQTPTTASGSAPRHPAPCLTAIFIPEHSHKQRNSCGSSDFSSTGFSLLPPRRVFAGCAEGEFWARRDRHLIAQRLSGWCRYVWFQSGLTDFLQAPFCFLFSCEFHCEEKCSLSVEAWCCSNRCCVVVCLDLGFYFINWKLKRVAGLCSLPWTDMSPCAAAAPPLVRDPGLKKQQMSCQVAGDAVG